MKKVVAYIRCSTTTQVEEGVSLEAQEAAIRSYCHANGLELAEVLIDAGVSGSTPLENRPQGARLPMLMKRKGISAVVATKLDRCFRSSHDALATTDKWAKKNVGLILLDLGGAVLDTTTTMGRLMLTMVAGFGEAERSLIAERTKSALQHKKAQGLRVSGRAPLGFRFSAGRLVEDEQEQKVLSKVRTLRGLGYSWRKIADTLNKQSVPCRGKKWYASALHAAVAQV